MTTSSYQLDFQYSTEQLITHFQSSNPRHVAQLPIKTETDLVLQHTAFTTSNEDIHKLIEDELLLLTLTRNSFVVGGVQVVQATPDIYVATCVTGELADLQNYCPDLRLATYYDLQPFLAFPAFCSMDQITALVRMTEIGKQ